MGASAIAAALRLQSGEPSAFLTTIAQADEWRANLDAPAVSVSGNGRFVAFASYAPLVTADTNSRRDIYVLDRADGRVSLESVRPDGRATECDSSHPSISGDGTRLVYETAIASWSASAPSANIVLRKRTDGAATVIGADLGGSRRMGHSPVISADGRFVAFVSAGNPTPAPDANGLEEDVYLFDVTTSRTTRVSVNEAGVQPPTGSSRGPAISGDGRFIAFTSSAPLHAAVSGATPMKRAAHPHIFLRDQKLNVTRLVTMIGTGAVANGASWQAAIDATGRYVAFTTMATNLAAGDRNAASDVFVANLGTGTLELASRSASGGSGNGPSAGAVLSADARFVAFQSEAADLTCAKGCRPWDEDINLLWDVFLLDRPARLITRVSADGNAGWMEASVGPRMDGSGLVVAFSSRRPMDPFDTRNDFDLFIRAPRSSPSR